MDILDGLDRYQIQLFRVVTIDIMCTARRVRIIQWWTVWEPILKMQRKVNEKKICSISSGDCDCFLVRTRNEISLNIPAQH